MSASQLALRARIDLAFQNEREPLKQDEGFEDEIYLLNGVPHIGYGFNLTEDAILQSLENVGWTTDDRLSVEAANRVLDQLILAYSSELHRLCVRKGVEKISPAAASVLVNAFYNMGGPALSGFRNMWYWLGHEDYVRSADEMRDSAWFRHPLTHRRASELADRMAVA
jgi:GH24 family phage-related lysozyme (muramidase)